jgi:hypothetical protein
MVTPDEKFDVYVEGATDPSPQGLARAAQALAPKLAMPADKVSKLLASRFRVRTRVDAELADRLVRELARAGVRAAAAPAAAAKASVPPATAAKPARAPAALAKPAPAPARATQTLPRAPAPPRPPVPPPMSAPVEHDDGGISIGGLSDPGALPLDATTAAEPPAGGGFMPSSFGPPPEDNEPLELATPPPRSTAPPATATPRPAAKPAALPAPADPFAPPDTAEELDLELAAPKLTPRPVSAPEVRRIASGSRIPVLSVARPTSARMSGAAIGRALRRGLLVLVVSVAAGYFPAHFYAQRVDDNQVRTLQVEYQDLAVNPWKGEATHRSKEKVREEISARRWNASLLMMGIWAAVAGLLATCAYVLL